MKADTSLRAAGPPPSTQECGEITEEEFEALLDQLHGRGGAPGLKGASQRAGSKPPPLGPTSLHLPRPAAEPLWHIVFRPHAKMLQSGNEPARIFRELESLGALAVTPDLRALPAFDAMDPEACYLAWTLELRTDASRKRIAEAFAWVEGECELEIAPVSGIAGPLPGEQGGRDVAVTGQRRQKALPEQAGPRTPDPSPLAIAEPKPSVGPNPLPPATTATRLAPGGAGGETASIRVAIDKIDALVNLVGELVITQSMLSQLADRFDARDLPKLMAGLAQLERNTRELQESVMRIRMLPISFVFNRFPRLVYDLSAKLGKRVELKMSGEHTELDKTVMERIGDPLVHLVRNALDHGIESPGVRRAAGKPESGTLHLNAYHQSGNIVIEISDDGAGLDKERILVKARQRGLVKDETNLTDERIYGFVFLPGFSTAEQVSDISGRGVGMDVVRRNIKALGGSVDIRSQKGRGTTVVIRLPLTLAIVDGQTVSVGGEVYIIPLVSIVETVRIRGNQVNTVAGKAEVVRLRDEYLPILRLYEVLDAHPKTRDLEEGLLVIVEGEGRKAGLFVDELLGQQQVVIKSLEANFRRVRGVAGATILGDGTVALILDVPELIRLALSAVGDRYSTAGHPWAEKAQPWPAVAIR